MIDKSTFLLDNEILPTMAVEQRELYAKVCALELTNKELTDENTRLKDTLNLVEKRNEKLEKINKEYFGIERTNIMGDDKTLLGNKDRNYTELKIKLDGIFEDLDRIHAMTDELETEVTDIHQSMIKQYFIGRIKAWSGVFISDKIVFYELLGLLTANQAEKWADDGGDRMYFAVSEEVYTTWRRMFVLGHLLDILMDERVGEDGEEDHVYNPIIADIESLYRQYEISLPYYVRPVENEYALYGIGHKFKTKTFPGYELALEIEEKLNQSREKVKR